MGFLDVLETTEKGGYTGALLVTDLSGIPLEFRCTHSVRPTMVQRPLYGKSLEAHIGVDLCGKQLDSATRVAFDMLVVRKKYLLAIRKSMKRPAVCVVKAGDAMVAADSAQDSKRIDARGTQYAPLMLAAEPDFPSDVEIAKETFSGAHFAIDPLEPFERIEQAIAQLRSNDERFN